MFFEQRNEFYCVRSSRRGERKNSVRKVFFSAEVETYLWQTNAQNQKETWSLQAKWLVTLTSCMLFFQLVFSRSFRKFSSSLIDEGKQNWRKENIFIDHFGSERVFSPSANGKSIKFPFDAKWRSFFFGFFVSFVRSVSECKVCAWRCWKRWFSMQWNHETKFYRTKCRRDGERAGMRQATFTQVSAGVRFSWRSDDGFVSVALPLGRPCNFLCDHNFSSLVVRRTRIFNRFSLIVPLRIHTIFHRRRRRLQRGRSRRRRRTPRCLFTLFIYYYRNERKSSTIHWNEKKMNGRKRGETEEEKKPVRIESNRFLLNVVFLSSSAALESISRECILHTENRFGRRRRYRREMNASRCGALVAEREREAR